MDLILSVFFNPSVIWGTPNLIPLRPFSDIRTLLHSQVRESRLDLKCSPPPTTPQNSIDLERDHLSTRSDLLLVSFGAARQATERDG